MFNHQPPQIQQCCQIFYYLITRAPLLQLAVAFSFISLRPTVCLLEPCPVCPLAPTHFSKPVPTETGLNSFPFLIPNVCNHYHDCATNHSQQWSKITARMAWFQGSGFWKCALGPTCLCFMVSRASARADWEVLPNNWRIGATEAHIHSSIACTTNNMSHMCPKRLGPSQQEASRTVSLLTRCFLAQTFFMSYSKPYIVATINL